MSSKHHVTFFASYQTVNIHLKEKPEWFLERNPLGQVPVLEQDGRVVYESPITCAYLEDLFPEPRLVSADPYQRARDRILYEAISAVTGPYYKLVFFKTVDKETVDAAKSALAKYEKELKDRGDFFGGKAPNIVDFMIWP